MESDVQPMNANASMSSSTGVAAPAKCPLCGASVVPDQWGLVECTCGWGGPGDPLEAARGFSRLATLTDRRLANAAARRERARLARPRWRPGNLGFFYTGALLVMSTAIYLVVGAVIACSAAALANFAVPADVPARPAAAAITPAGATDASEVERELTARLFAPPKQGKRKRR